MSGKAKKQQERAVILGVEHPGGRRSVVFGYTDSDLDAATVRVRDARKAVFWSRETRGVIGLATKGPQQGSKITAKVPMLELRNLNTPTGPKIGMVMTPTAEAIAEWEKGRWE